MKKLVKNRKPTNYGDYGIGKRQWPQFIAGHRRAKIHILTRQIRRRQAMGRW